MDKIAQGRVWTGQDAEKFGLVDQMGDFDDAIALAAELANLDDYNLYWVEEPLTPAQEFIQNLMSEVKVKLGLDVYALIPHTPRPAATQIIQDTSLLSSFNDPKGQYALFELPS